MKRGGVVGPSNEVCPGPAEPLSTSPLDPLLTGAKRFFVVTYLIGHMVFISYSYAMISVKQKRKGTLFTG